MTIYSDIVKVFKGENATEPQRIIELLGYIGKVSNIEDQDNQILVVYKMDRGISDFTIITSELFFKFGLVIKGFKHIQEDNKLHVWISKPKRDEE